MQESFSNPPRIEASREYVVVLLPWFPASCLPTRARMCAGSHLRGGTCPERTYGRLLALWFANLNSSYIASRHVTVRPCMCCSLLDSPLKVRFRQCTFKPRPSEDNTGLASGTVGSCRQPPASSGRSSCARRGSEKACYCPVPSSALFLTASFIQDSGF